MSDLRIERGDIFYVGLTPFVTGREQLAGRPGIIVSNDQNNLHSETVEVVYCTTRYKPNLPTHTTVLSTPYESTVLCEQVTTVDISRLGNYIGRCTEKEMREIDRCIRVSLGLQEDKTVKSNPAYVPPMGNTQKESEEMIALRVERDTYQKMYEMVVEKLADMAIIAGALKMENEYDIYRPFDAEKHKAKYSNYLEVLILEDGTVVYAIPSHQEKAIALACEKHGLSRDELVAMCPREYYLDYMVWLLKMSGAIAVWTSGCEAPAVTERQIIALKKLKIMGLYKGSIPKIAGDDGEE